MESPTLHEGVEMDSHQTDTNLAVKTCDVYKVHKNLPKRFNHPDCFRGYSKTTVHPLYQTTNQTYGNRKPTVHEMPTSFHGTYRKFSEHMLKSGMFRDNGFNTSLDKSRITGPNTITTLQDRISFHHLYSAGGNSHAESHMD